MRRRIALDLDGVFADFAKKAHELHGKDYHQLSNNVFWSKFTQVPHLFRDLDLIPNSKKLLDYAITIPKHEVFVLTALPLPTGELHTAKQDKHEWVHTHLGKIPVFTVRGGVNKRDWVKAPGDILIDDTKRNIDAWEAVGGVGILHTDVDDTISKLKKLIKHEHHT